MKLLQSLSNSHEGPKENKINCLTVMQYMIICSNYEYQYYHCISLSYNKHNENISVYAKHSFSH